MEVLGFAVSQNYFCLTSVKLPLNLLTVLQEKSQ